MTNRIYTAALAGSLLSLAGVTAWGLSPEDKCESAKNQLAGKYAFCRLKAEAKAIKKGTTPDFSKCEAALQGKWAKAEQKAVDKGSSCVDTVSAGAVESFLGSQTDAVVTALDGNAPSGRLPATGDVTTYGAGSDGAVQAGRALAYVDNGDGTVSDPNTGLMWEKKDDSGGIHDQDNQYTWSAGGTAMDGTIVTGFLDVLNDVAGGGSNCFAGHCDWRVPNIREIVQGFVSYGASLPAVEPVFHQPTCAGCGDVTLASCSCTVPFVSMLSSTSFSSTNVMIIFPYDGGVFETGKTGLSGAARAVRGGL